MMLVFVYGTLKSNQPNHYLLTDPSNGAANFISNGKTSNCYPLLIGTRYNIPFLVNKSGIGYQINGEIYNVDERMLRKLDELEGHPNYYLRQEITVSYDNGSLCTCWIYFLKNYPDDFLKDRQLINNYENSIQHPYILPSQRPNSPKPSKDLGYRP